MGEGNAVVTIQLDKVRRIRFDFAALCRLEDFGVELAELMELAEKKRVKVILIAQMLAAGLTDAEFQPSPAEVVEMIDKMPGNLAEKIAAITEAVKEAFSLAMPELEEGNAGRSPEGDSTGAKSASSDSASSD